MITLEAEVSAYSLTCLRRLWSGAISPIEDYPAPKRSRVRMFSFNVSGPRYIVLNGFFLITSRILAYQIFGRMIMVIIIAGTSCREIIGLMPLNTRGSTGTNSYG